MDSGHSKERFGSLYIKNQDIVNSLALFLHIKKKRKEKRLPLLSAEIIKAIHLFYILW